jgi:hypothetical protein
MEEHCSWMVYVADGFRNKGRTRACARSCTCPFVGALFRVTGIMAFFFKKKQFHYSLYAEKTRFGPKAAAGPVGNSGGVMA